MLENIYFCSGRRIKELFLGERNLNLVLKEGQEDGKGFGP